MNISSLVGEVGGSQNWKLDLRANVHMQRLATKLSTVSHVV